MRPLRTARPIASTGKLNMGNQSDPSEMSGRQLKQWVRRLLESDAGWADIFKAVDQLRARRVVNPLFACFYDKSARIRWRAIAVMGHTVSGLAKSNMESARVVMRRLMWNLN